MLLLTANAAGKDGFASYPEQKISLKGVTEMKIVGVHGNLRLSGSKGGRFLRLKVRHSAGSKFDDWSLSVDRRGKTLYLEVSNVAYGAQWSKWVRHELWPTFDIELNGAPVPTTVGWRDGTINVNNWDAALEISFLKGVAHVHGGHGRLILQPTQAQLTIDGHSGELRIKGESGDIFLNRNKGRADVNWMEGKVDVIGGRGKLDLQMARGVVRVAAFNGKIQGKTEAVKWDLNAAAPADLDISNASGPVGLHWTAGGARVFLTSARGPIEILHSDFLSRETREGHQVAQGVKTAAKMGQVFVHTDSGAIRWRQ